MSGALRSLMTFAFVAVLLYVLFNHGKVPVGLTKPVELDYSVFVDKIKANEVAKVNIAGDVATGELKAGAQKFIARLPEDPKLYEILRQYHVHHSFNRSFLTGFWGNALIMGVLPVVLLFLLWMFILRQAQYGPNQALSFGRSKAKRTDDNMPKVTFEDVAGVEEAKQELREVIEFLKSPDKFQKLGAKIPKGVLLLGPPGSGKTLLARAVAGEACVPFYHISGSDFVEMFVGVGASRVRDLFERAKATRPCIVFIDEIDAVGRQRFAGLGGGHDEREQTLNQLLVEMDGFDPNSGVILIAATNRPDVLDPALLRPGRFDRRIVVDNPDLNGRRAILNVHAKGKPLATDVDIDVLGRRTPGFSGADLANLVNEAALLAGRKSQAKIEMTDFTESIDRVMAGPERRSRLISDEEKEIVAYHEAGHALVSKLLPKADPVQKVTILSRGLALGYTLQAPLEDRYLMTKSQLLDRLTGLLGGRVSEETHFHEVTTGAQNDLEQATEIARRMVCEYGMSEKLGPLTLGRRHGPIFLGRDLVEDRNYSEDIASEIDKEVRRIVQNCHDRATALVQANQDKLEAIVQRLLEKETVEADQLDEVLEKVEGERQSSASSEQQATGMTGS